MVTASRKTATMFAPGMSSIALRRTDSITEQG
jgi:hypothetical protein